MKIKFAEIICAFAIFGLSTSYAAVSRVVTTSNCVGTNYRNCVQSGVRYVDGNFKYTETNRRIITPNVGYSPYVTPYTRPYVRPNGLRPPLPNARPNGMRPPLPRTRPNSLRPPVPNGARNGLDNRLDPRVPNRNPRN